MSGDRTKAWLRAWGLDVALVAVQVALCAVAWRATGRADFRPAVFCVFLPALRLVCTRGMREARRVDGVEFWWWLFVVSLVGAAALLIFRGRA